MIWKKRPIEKELAALSSNFNQLCISNGSASDVQALSTSGTNVNYNVIETGWYTVRANTGNSAGPSFVRLTIGNTIILRISASLGQYDQLMPSPVFIKAGTQIKGMAGFPANGSGAIVKIT